MSGERVRRIGVMGGTFDPIHYGHLVTAEGARTEFGLDEVWFVPAGQPPHKDPSTVTAAEHRYMMTVLATLSNRYFHVSRVDIDREGPSYAIDTLRALKAQCGPGCELYFITGADAILEILTWKDAALLLQEWRFIAATRPGFQLERLQSRLGDWWEQCADRITFLQVPALAISSTDIRRRVSENRSIRYLLPDVVAHYIHKNGLYRSSAPPVPGSQAVVAGGGGAARS